MRSIFRHDGDKDMGRIYVGLSVIFILISIVCLVAILRLRSLALSTEQQAEASNATPSVDEIIPSDTTLVGDIRIPAEGLTPNEGTTVNLFVRGQVSDQNGCANLDHVDIKVYRSSVTDGSACTLDNNDCYSASIAKAQLVGCTAPGITDVTFETSIPVANYADPTDAGSQYADDTWKATATVYDALDDSSSMEADFEVRSLGAFSLSADHLNYGIITLGGTSPQQSLTFSNTGNRLVNSYVSADDDLKSDLTGFSDILSTAVHYSSTNSFTYGSNDAAIQTSPELWEFNLASQTDDATIPTVPGYFLMQVPNSGVNGTYSNIVTFTADAPAYVGPDPEILGMSLTAVPIGTGDTSVAITGTNFPTDAVGRVNGVDRVTTRTDSSHLSITLLAADLSTAGEKTIAIYNPTSNSTSTAQIFMVAPLTTTCPITGNDVTIATNCQFDSGTYTFTGTLTVNSGVTVTANSAYNNSKVTIVAENLNLIGNINGDQKGYIGKNGPGTPSTSVGGTAGASYAGIGGQGNYNGYHIGPAPYGSYSQPIDLGSGGQDYYNNTNGGKGGGAIKLMVSNTATINGTISANGQTPTIDQSGGGSGGSIWITAQTLAGSGTITANGGGGRIDGSGYGSNGGGSGGRIAVYYTNLDSGSTLISGNKMRAYGGLFDGAYYAQSGSGGGGTIFLKQATQTNGDMIVDSNNLAWMNNTLISGNSTFDKLTIRNGAKYVVASGDTLSIASTGSLLGGGTNRPLVTVNSGGTFNPPTTGSWTLTSMDLTNAGTLNSVTDLTLSNSTCTQDTTGNFAAILTSYTGNSGGDLVLKSLSGVSLNTLTVNSAGTFTSGLLTTIPVTTVTVNTGGNLTHLANSTSKSYQLNLTATDLTVNAGGRIDVNAKGFIGKNGPGGFSTGGTAGAGYGGNGGSTSGNAGGIFYGSYNQPTDLGSGGQESNNTTNGGKGGGAIKLTVSGTATINGTVSAKGGLGSTSYSGGGSGGSIWITAGFLDGTGAITANGGNAVTGYDYIDNSGGGGGRIALNYTTASPTMSSGSNITAAGGARWDGGYVSQGPTAGGAGTIFIKPSSATNGNLIVDQSNVLYAVNTQITGNNTFDSVTIRNGAKYVVVSGDTLTVPSTGVLTGGGTSRPSITVNSGGTFSPPTTGSFTLSSVDLTNNGTVNTVTDLTLANATCTQGTTGNFAATLSTVTANSGGDFVVKGLTGLSLSSVTVNSNGAFTSGMLGSIPVTTVTVNSGGNLTHLANSTSKLYQLDLTANDLTIASGGKINVDFKGFIGKNGPGGFSTAGTAGAGYGGVGGTAPSNAGGPAYGSDVNPVDLGSGGQSSANDTAGGKGGGAIKLTVSGTATINGTISAKGGTGTNTYSGGGSGGSIWASAGVLSGAGTMTVNGGAGTTGDNYANNGGGAGGRAAVYYTTDSSTIISGSKITAAGGAAWDGPYQGGTVTAGSPGTIVTAAQ